MFGLAQPEKYVFTCISINHAPRHLISRCYEIYFEDTVM